MQLLGPVGDRENPSPSLLPPRTVRPDTKPCLVISARRMQKGLGRLVRIQPGAFIQRTPNGSGRRTDATHTPPLK